MFTLTHQTQPAAGATRSSHDGQTSGFTVKFFIYSQRQQPGEQDDLTSPYAGKNNPPTQQPVLSEEPDPSNPLRSSDTPQITCSSAGQEARREPGSRQNERKLKKTRSLVKERGRKLTNRSQSFLLMIFII